VNNSKNQPPGLSPAELKSLLANVLADGSGDRLEVDIIIDNYSLDNIPKIIEKINKHISSNQDLIKLKFEFTHTQNVPNEEDKKLAFFNQLLDAIYENPAIKHSKVLLELSGLLKHIGDTDPANIFKNQFAQKQRKYHQAILIGTNPPTDPLPLEVDQKTSSEKKPIRRNRENALVNVSSQVNMQQQAEQQSEQQEEVQQQAQQEAQLQLQRQQNISALQQRMQKNNLNNSPAKEKKGITDFTDFMIKIVNKGDVTKQINAGSREYKMHLPRWNILCGDRISVISEAVAQKLMKEPDFFKSGLSLDALPPGFSLHPVIGEPDKFLLDYSEVKYKLDLKNLEKDENSSPLYPTTPKLIGLNLNWIGDHRQFSGLLENDFRMIYEEDGLSRKNRTITDEKKIDLFLKLLKATDSDYFTHKKEISIRESLYLKYPVRSISELPDEDIDQAVDHTFYLYPDGRYFFKSGEAEISGELKNKLITPKNFLDPNFTKLISKEIIKKHKIKPKLDYSFQLEKLARIVNIYGAEGADIILQSISSLKLKFEPTVSRDFINIYINNKHIPYDALLNKDRQDALSKVMNFSSEELKVFLNLTTGELGGEQEYLDLKTQVDNFIFFKEKLLTLGISDLTPLLQPQSLPQIGNQNMAVMMQRIITILEHSISPVEQFNHLGGLDLSPFKAYRAITEENECHEKYRFVTEKMGFNNEKYDKVKKQLEFNASMSASHIENVEPPKFNSTLSDFIYLKELFKSGKETEIEPLYYQSLFLRILGKTNNADRYSEYEQIINLFNADTNSRQIIKLNRVLENSIANTPPPPIVPPLALALIAFATIHDEVLTIKPEIYTQVVDKLTKFNNATPESKSALLAYLDLTNNEDPPVKRPTPEQLLSLIDFHKDLGKEHPWNKDGDLLYTPKNINFLKSVAKLGDVYYEVIQTHYAFRLPDAAAASAKNIAILADVLSIVDLNNPNLEKHRNDLFKILSYCDYTDLTNQKIKDFIDSTLKNFDPIKLQIAMDILSSAKFSKQDSPHPTFENLIGVLETIEKSDIQNETAIFDTIRNSIGFSKLEFSTKNAKDDDGKAIKQLIQDNLEEIKEMLPMLDMEWNDKYNEDPTSLISAIIEKTKGNLALRAAIAIGVGKFFPTMQADTNTRINKYITEKLNQKEDKVEQTNAANIKHFLNAHYFEQLKLDRNLDGLSASLTTLADYETQAKDFIDQISELKNINPKAYKDTVRNLLESHDLNKIPLESLTLLIGSVLKKQKPKFNHSIIKTIVSHSSLKDIPRNNENDLKIKSLIEQVIIPRIINNKTLGIPIPSLNAIIDSIMTINSHDNITNKEIEKIIKLLKIKESKNELISVIHAIAKHNNPKAIIENILRVADVVKSFSIKTTEFIPDFYSKIGKNVDDLSTIGEKFGHHDLSLDEKKNILMILLKTNYIFQDASTKNPENMLNDLLDNILGLEQQKRTEFLSTLANFSSSVQCPYPDAKKIKAVIDAGKSAANLLSELTTDLENSRNDLKKLAIRFDDSKVLQILENMKDLSHEKGLGYPQKKHLHQQFHIVNHLGQHVQLSIDINNPDSSKKYIKNMDDSDIKLLLSQYRKIISDSKSPDLEKKHAKLIYLALLRESMFRTTVFGIPPQGRMPNSTQIIAVLNAMNQGGNNIAEIQTGQGKSLISAMYAAMLQAEGQAVDIATSNLQLAEEGLDENKDFYSYIGVKTSVVTAGMDFNDYQLEGINYSDVSQLALFRSRALIEGAELPKKVSLVLDEADYTLLDDKTQYRYAANLDPTASSQNIFEWIYPLINDFIDETDKNKSLSEGAGDLKAYLLKKAPNMRTAIENIDLKQLDTWIDSAISAYALYHKMGTAWALKKEERNGKIISVAQLIINATVSPDARWSNGVHQFVHARINAKIIQENKEKPDSQKEPLCPIEPETAAVASLSSKNFLDFYKDRGGEVWGITGTIGSKQEKTEHEHKFGFKLTSIPSHQINQRITRDPILIETNDAHKQEIFNQILQDMRNKDKRPALVICKDANDAKELHDFLLQKLSEDKYKKQCPASCLQLVSALEQTQSRFPLPPSPDDRTEPNQKTLKMKDYLDQAGHAGTITITTPTLGRGSDYKPIIFKDSMKKQHPHGLFEITSYLDIERNERQFQGRTSRQGAKGETVTILSKEALEVDLKNVGENTDISKIKKRKLNKYIKIIRDRRDYSAKDQRKQSDVLGDIRNIYFKKMLSLLDNFDSYYNDANINNKPDISLYRVRMLYSGPHN
jgi:preprotein translocase subunit SecA